MCWGSSLQLVKLGFGFNVEPRLTVSPTLLRATVTPVFGPASARRLAPWKLHLLLMAIKTVAYWPLNKMV